MIFDNINFPFNKKFKKYYPLDIIITGKDILFCWILRMIIMNFYFNKKIPFKNVFFTGLLKNKDNIKMSKSLNNVPNLNLLIKKYGIDNLRLGLLLNNNYGKDLIYTNKLFLKSNKIIIKLKNIYKFIKNLKISNNIKLKKYDKENIKYIYTKLKFLLYKNKIFMDKYLIFDSIKIICDFLKEDFSNFFIFFIKKSIKKYFYINRNLYKNIIYIYKIILKLLHPIIPFITDFLFNKINKIKYINIYNKYLLINTKYPIFIKKINIKNVLIYKTILKKINNKIFKYKIKKFNLIYFKKIKYLFLIKKYFNIKKIFYKKYIYIKYKILPIFINDIFLLLILNKKINYNFKTKIKYYKKYLYFIKKKINNKFYLKNTNNKIINYENKKYLNIKKRIFLLKKLYFKYKK
ncbi:MAG: class I tRNA ligase family protein [Candidatus Shikimatogenerans sp. Tser]|uniref:valine--tRNA ligase n=1 Tax=Candidatus Shikimatogenerans sp. Tser TaxID=3158568 RepID=A0AAU7QTP1_9FLAO